MNQKKNIYIFTSWLCGPPFGLFGRPARTVATCAGKAHGTRIVLQRRHGRRLALGQQRRRRLGRGRRL
jgi:hypothetical protein